MTGTRESLAGHPFFAGLAPATLDVLAPLAEPADLPSGAYLFHEGEPADRFYVLLEGRVAVEIRTPTGPSVLDAALGGDVVGWSWLIPPYRWMFDARTTEPTSALVFDGARLRAVGEADCGVGYALLRRVTQVMSHRLASARIRLLDLYGEAR